jgi:hypothetical protein
VWAVYFHAIPSFQTLPWVFWNTFTHISMLCHRKRLVRFFDFHHLSTLFSISCTYTPCNGCTHIYMYGEILIHILPRSIYIYPFHSRWFWTPPVPPFVYICTWCVSYTYTHILLSLQALFAITHYSYRWLLYLNKISLVFWVLLYHVINICIYIHTYEYTEMYSMFSSVHHDLRESISMHMHMTILSRIYTYIHVYIYIYKCIHTHTYTCILELLCPCPISPRPAALSPPSAVRSLRHVRRPRPPHYSMCEICSISILT